MASGMSLVRMLLSKKKEACAPAKADNVADDAAKKAAKERMKQKMMQATIDFDRKRAGGK